ncbi:MAG TPA: phenylacetate--CoA ligase, partial [Sporichthya sp.]|nr:phenylacetate--CoA ligase [Sporichthya sp.]
MSSAASTDPRGELDPIELASADEVAAVAEERLRWSVRHAYSNSPATRAAFDAAGAHPGDIHGLADLAKVPFMTKADLRADNWGRFAMPKEKLARIHASSGTTGLATVVGYTAEDLQTWAGLMARSIRAAGGRPGH